MSRNGIHTTVRTIKEYEHAIADGAIRAIHAEIERESKWSNHKRTGGMPATNDVYWDTHKFVLCEDGIRRIKEFNVPRES